MLILKRKKYLIATIAMSTMMILCARIPAFAETEIEMVNVDNVAIPVYVEYYDSETLDLLSDNIMPRYKYIKQLGAGLKIQNKEAHIYAECITYDKASLSVDVEFQRKENGIWKTIKTYSNSANSTECVVSETYTVSSGYDYRAKVKVSANGETASGTSSIEHCN